jgi:uncharacterized membrane protein
MKTKTSILPLTVIAFDNPTQAFQLQKALVNLEGESVYDFQDAVVVTRNAAGKVKLHQTRNPVPGFAAAGSLSGLILGTLFLLGFPGSVVGLGVGALVGKLLDVGVDDRFMKDLGATLKPGTSALAFLGTAQLDKLKERIGPLLKGSTLLQTTVNPEREAEIRKLLASQ